MERVRRIPDRFRWFHETRRSAAVNHGIDPSLLGELLDLGLPHAGAGEDLLLDGIDCTNLSLCLRLRAPRRIALRGWGRALRSEAAGQARRHQLRIVPRCPYPGHPGGCGFRVLPDAVLDAAHETAGATAVLDGCDARVHLPADPSAGQSVPAELRPVLDTLSEVDYQILPRELERDLAFLRDSNLACCMLASTLLVQEAALRGIEARPSFGLTVVPPFAMPHAWVEFRVAGRWTAWDPHLLKALRAWGLCDADSWPDDRALSRFFLRLGARSGPVATHHGLHTDVSMTVV
ncbi:hypothetical protein [Streptomyces sp. NPDC026589]|uniref:hypothetical protein n=1 Tax=Streptomyces sp. NPDC026589 TaxID=3155609 RepID=UPI0033DD4F8A